MTDVTAQSEDKSPTLGPQELEFFLSTVETATRIRKRFQFYLWAQGTLQSFIPHETLLCCVGQPGTQQSVQVAVTRHIASDEEMQALYAQEGGFTAQLWQRWRDAGQTPIVVQDTDARLGALMRHHHISSALCHGFMPPILREPGHYHPGSFFTFLKLPEPIAALRLLHLADILLPYLHLALLQISHSDAPRPTGSHGTISEGLLSERERDVLKWIRAGKTNHEIGMILAISPMTVKNHVQKILRKLNVSNRAQAAALGIEPQPAPSQP
jgi:transcriptional regulator EpsA